MYHYYAVFFFYGDGDHRDLHVGLHSFPTRRSSDPVRGQRRNVGAAEDDAAAPACQQTQDRKSTRLNSSHSLTARMPSSAGKKKSEEFEDERLMDGFNSESNGKVDNRE